MRFARLVLPSLVIVFLFAAAGAGGGGKGTPGSESNPLVAMPNPTPARIPPSEQPVGEGPNTTGATQPSTSTKTQRGSTAMHDGRPMVARPQTPRLQQEQPPSAGRPCSLVAKAQAQTIIGAPIGAPIEAPQGPTCIYRAASGASYVTLAARNASIDQLRPQVSDPRPTTVGGRAGYCGTIGGPVLHVALSDRRTLVVAAPCQIAQRFAELAIERLG